MRARRAPLRRAPGRAAAFCLLLLVGVSAGPACADGAQGVSTTGTGERSADQARSGDRDAQQTPASPGQGEASETVVLPEAQRDGEVSLEAALAARRSTRRFASEPVPLELVAQLLWAAQGVNRGDSGYRTAPSAGATFPLEVDLVAAGVPGLDDGVWRYLPEEHALRLRRAGDRRAAVVDASSSQETLASGQVLIVFSAEHRRTEERYGSRAERYVAMEAGHAAQNLLLQAAARGLGVVVVGAFRDDDLAEALGLERQERPLYVIPVGWPEEGE